MKKIYKFLVLILMFALAVGSIMISPVAVLAATGTAIVGAGAVLSIKKVPSKKKISEDGGKITIPKATGDNVAVEVKDPQGNVLDASKIQEVGDNYEFIAETTGEYTVTYTANKTISGNNVETKKVYTITVTGSDISLDFTENSPFIVNSRVGADANMVLPYPNVTVDGDVFEGHYADSSANATDANIEVSIAEPNSTTWVESNETSNPLGTTTVDGKKYYTFKPATTVENGETKTIYGTYVVYFKYKSIATGDVVTKSQKIVVSESADSGEITFTWNGSLPESAVLGVETELPKPVTTYKNSGNAVATYTKVFVSYNGGEDVEVNDFKFTPMQEAKNGTYYTITYRIYTLSQLDLANHTTLEEAIEAADANQNDKVLEKKYTLSSVTDTKSPVVAVVNDYDVEDDNTLTDATVTRLENEDVSYAIPSKAKTHVEIAIPAIYATDNYSNYKNLTMTRTIIDEDGNTYSLDGEGLYNATVEGEDLVVTDSTKPAIRLAKANQTAKVLFTMNGTYTVRYRVTDNAGNSKEVSYKIVASDGLTDSVAPYIVMPTIDNTVYPEDTLTFGDPTVTDYKDDHHASNVTTTATVDSNVKVDVYYFYGEANNRTDVENMTKVEKNDASKYEINVDANPTSKYLTIVVRAEDDAKYSTGKTENNVAYEYKTVIIYEVDDNKTPTLETLDTGVDAETYLNNVATILNDKEYGQNQLVELDSNIHFTDLDTNDANATQNLVASLKVYDKNGNEINVRGLNFVYEKAKDNNNEDRLVYSIKGGKFYTTVAGTYQVVITATDLGGNTLINSYYFNVKDTKAPTVEFENTQTTMELGKTYKLSQPVVKDDGAVIENQALTQVEFDENCPEYLFNQGTFEFTPMAEGTYTYYYLADDGNGNTRRVLGGTIEVKDTIAPVIKINETDEYKIPETAPYKDNNGNVVNVSLPLFSATDEYNGIKETSLTVKDSNGDEVENVQIVGDHYEFTPSKNGTYTVTYKAVDKAGKSTTNVYTIQVGDVSAPALKGAVTPGTYNVGDTMKISTDNLSLVDNNDGTTSATKALQSGKLKVVLVNPDGSSTDLVDDDEIKDYEFTKAGTYTLKYTVKDTAGNEDNINYTFVVKAKSDTTTIKEIAWGTALIVASVALVAGVIVYFIKTKDAPVEADKKKEESK